MKPNPPTKQAARRRLTCKSCFGSGRIDDHESPVRRCDDCVGNGYYYAKPKLPKQAARLPKAYTAYSDIDKSLWETPLEGSYPVAVIPGRGKNNKERLQSARALIRVAGFFAMGEGEQVEALQDIIYRAIPYAGKRLGYADSSSAAKTARAVLTLIASGGARK